MKRSTPRKLTLRSQAIRVLTPEAYHRIVGGNLEIGAAGFIMRDTIIIRTGGIAPAPSEGDR